MSDWITKQDILEGIKVLMQNGKKLPYGSKLKEIAESFPQGTSIEIIREACIKEQRKQVNQIASAWFEVIVPEEKYRKSMPVMDKERWELAIKQTLLVKDYHKVLDISIVAQGIDLADAIISKANEAAAYEAQKKANAEWRSFGDVFEEEDKYRNTILAHWTAIRLKKGILEFDFPSIDDAQKPNDLLMANRKMLMNEAKNMFPNISDDILRKNLMLFGMQHVNTRHCEKKCSGWDNCYMNGHRLGLRYDNGRFYVSNSAEICPKFLAAKEAARRAEEERKRKIQEFLKEQGA